MPYSSYGSKRYVASVTLLATVAVVWCGGLHGQASASPTARSPARGAPGVTLSPDLLPGNTDSTRFRLIGHENDFTLWGVTAFADRIRPDAPLELPEVYRLTRVDSALGPSTRVDLEPAGAFRDNYSVHGVGESILWLAGMPAADDEGVLLRAELTDRNGNAFTVADVLRLPSRDYGDLQHKYAPSPNRRFTVEVLLIRTNLGQLSGDQPNLAVGLYDTQDGSVDWTLLRLSGDNLDLATVGVDDSGTVAFVLHEAESNTSGGDVATRTSTLHTLEQEAPSTQTTVLSLPSASVVLGASLLPASDDALAIAGAYGGTREGPITGTFLIPTVTAVDSVVSQPFTQDEIRAFGQAANAYRDSRHYLSRAVTFREAIRTQTGEIALLLEDVREKLSNRLLSRRLPAHEPSEPEDIGAVDYRDGFIVTLGAGGRRRATLRVPKRQSTTVPNSALHGMRLVPYAGGAAVVYNDHPRNYFRAGSERRPRAFDSFSALAVIAYAEPDGRLAVRPLFDKTLATSRALILPSLVRLGGSTTALLNMRFDAQTPIHDVRICRIN